jgi:serine/threonine protein kinase
VAEEAVGQPDEPLAGLAAGATLAGYRLEERVGAGGMAVVFRAREEQLGRLVALKIAVPALAADIDVRERFIRESRAVAAVDHPHIVPVYAAGEAQGMLYIAMRFVAGGDLRTVLDREGLLPPARAAAFISPVASALDAAHKAGLVHRDVKPANILVDSSPGRPDHAMLSDFGASKWTVSSVNLTGTGHFIGTPGYAAPEQLSGLPADARTDQYALACVAFELLTGQLAFGGEHPWAVLNAHMTKPPPSAAALRPGLPPAVDAILGRALAKQPAQRFGSCGDFADALRDVFGLPPYAGSDAGYQPTQHVPSGAGAPPAAGVVVGVTQTVGPVAGKAPARVGAPTAPSAPTPPSAQPRPPAQSGAPGSLGPPATSKPPAQSGPPRLAELPIARKSRMPVIVAALAGVTAVVAVAFLLTTHVLSGLGGSPGTASTGRGTQSASTGHPTTGSTATGSTATGSPATAPGGTATGGTAGVAAPGTIPSVAVIGGQDVDAVTGPGGTLTMSWADPGSTVWHSEPVAGPGAALSAPAIATVEKYTEIAVEGPGHSLWLYRAVSGSSSWSGTRISGAVAYSAPSAAGGQFSGGYQDHIAVQGPDNSLLFYMLDGTSVAYSTRLAGPHSAFSVPSSSVFVDEDDLVAVEGPDNSLNMYDGSQLAANGGPPWSTWNVAGPGTTYSAPSVAAPGGFITIGAEGPDHSLRMYWGDEGREPSVNWTFGSVAPAGTTYSAPAVMENGDWGAGQNPAGPNWLGVAWMGQGNSLRFSWTTTDQGPFTWSPATVAGSGTTYSLPSIAADGSSAVISAVGPDGRVVSRQASTAG